MTIENHIEPIVEGSINRVSETFQFTLAHEGIFRKAEISMMRFQKACSENKNIKIINRCARRVKVYTWKLHLMNEEIKQAKGKAA